jgi:hypothetical protein
MDPVLLFIGVVVVLGGAVWFFNKGDDNVAGGGESGLKPTPVAPAKPVAKPKAEVKKAAPSAPKAPTAKALNAMTKKEIDQVGRDFGVELDARKTKAAMVKDFQAGIKAQKK